MADAAGDVSGAGGESALVSVFFVAILSVIVFPWTLSKLFGEKKEEVSVGMQGRPPVKKRPWIKSNGNFCFVLFWAILIWLCFSVAYNSNHEEQFDPFAILEVPTSASAKEIKSAYRKLSLIYHPDKNPDPQAADYFSNYVSKAYKTLTDEKARKNYELYGHPDGPSSTKFGWALPESLMNNKKVSLFGFIVVFLIILPTSFAMCWLYDSKRYANNVMVETLGIWLNQAQSPVHIKQAHSIHRVIETLTCAAEFAELPVQKKHYPLLESLMKNLIRYKALKEGDKMFKKKVELVRSHFTVLAWTHRIVCAKELKQYRVLHMVPKLMGELVKAAALPRIARHNFCWFAPTQAVIETMQCIIQAVPTEVKKPRTQGSGSNAGKASKGNAGLFQLPYVSEDVIKVLAKGTKDGKVKVKGLGELMALSDRDLKRLLTESLDKEVGKDGVQECFAMVRALPIIDVEECKCYCDQEEEIVVFDPTICELKLKLRRGAHLATIAEQQQNMSADHKSAYDSLVDKYVTKAGSSDSEQGKKLDQEVLDTLAEVYDIPNTKGQVMTAVAPRWPYKKPEKWYFLCGDLKANLLYSYGCVEMEEAEECGFRAALLEQFSKRCFSRLAKMGKNEYGYEGIKKLLPGKLEALEKKSGHRAVRLGFRAPPAGEYEVSVMVFCDSYLGCDKFLTRKIKVDSKARSAAAKDKEVSEKKKKKMEKSHEKQRKAKARAAEAHAASLMSIDDDETTSLQSPQANGDGPPELEEESSEDSDVEYSDEEQEQQLVDYADDESIADSDYSYDSQDTGTSIDEDFEELEMKHWTIQPPAAEDMSKGAKPGAAPPCGSACC